MTVGSWVTPAAVTVIAFALALRAFNRDLNGGGMLAGIAGELALAGAAVVAAGAWLIWALAR